MGIQGEAVGKLGQYKVLRGQSSVSGLSSGAFMTVQLHLAHSASFAGAGVVAGGPYRGVETYRGAAWLAEDAFELNALQLCMAPLTAEQAPPAARAVELAFEAERDQLIDPLKHLHKQRVYIFTGSEDKVVSPWVVVQTREMYRQLGVPDAQIAWHDGVPAGHALITANAEDSALAANLPPYINNGGFMQSHHILQHIYPDLKPAAERAGGRWLRFDQREFFGDAQRASMAPFGYAYVPRAVEEGEPARVHIALHGCKQGYDYVGFRFGQAETQDQPPYGKRYITTTGYAEIADSNNLIILFPQAAGRDDNHAQNPDGCWDWWGYTAANPQYPDYFSREALQIKAIHSMLSGLGG